jgi:hypothetical protein
MFRLIKLMPLLLLVCSCGINAPPASLPDQVNLIDLMGIIFDGVSSRLQNSGEYKPIYGSVAAVFEGTDEAGKFKFSYSHFSEPTLCAYMQSCSCTGILAGTFAAAKDPSTNGGNTTVETAPYDPNAKTEDNLAPIPDPNITIAYLALTIDFQASNLSQDCPPQSNRTVKISIQNNKTITYTDLGKDLILKPRVR